MGKCIILSAYRIQTALNKLQIGILPNDLHGFLNINNNDINTILKIDIKPKLYRRGELKAIKSLTKTINQQNVDI